MNTPRFTNDTQVTWMGESTFVYLRYMGKKTNVYVPDDIISVLGVLYPGLGLSAAVRKHLNTVALEKTPVVTQEDTNLNDDVLERIEALEMWKADMDMLG